MYQILALLLYCTNNPRYWRENFLTDHVVDYIGAFEGNAFCCHSNAIVEYMHSDPNILQVLLCDHFFIRDHHELMSIFRCIHINVMCMVALHSVP
jgi:hypothetical protein